MVPSGGALQLSAGDMSDPSHVNAAGMSSPGVKALVVKRSVIAKPIRSKGRAPTAVDCVIVTSPWLGTWIAEILM